MQEINDTAGLLFECIQESQEFRVFYGLSSRDSMIAEGIVVEEAEAWVRDMLSDRNFFQLTYKTATAGDPYFGDLLNLELEACQAALSGQSLAPNTVASDLYDCLQDNEEYKENFLLDTANNPVAGMSKEEARAGAEAILASRDLFVLSMTLAVEGDYWIALSFPVLVAECQASAGSSQSTADPLAQYAASHAGGPGAIFVGDIGQLAGPAVTDKFMSAYGTILGDDNGQVPLYALEQHQWLYETDYYQSLLEKARLTNPAQLVSRGELISLQHTCINTRLMWCQMFEAYFVPNVAARTNQQVHIDVSSFPELGLAGPDTADLIADGILDMAEIYGRYVGYEFPVLSLQYLWGLWPDHQTHFAVQTGIAADLDRVVTGEMGAQVLLRNWIAGDDQYIFSNLRLNSPTDFRDLKTRSYSSDLSDWLDGMGAPAQFLAFAEVYTALERGILDAAVTGANPALGQRWYEVTDYMNGPLTSFNSSIIAVNDQVWDGIPSDLQQILIEEGAKFELEALRLAAIQNITPRQRSIDAGIEYSEFSQEIRGMSFESAVESVIPGLLNRLRYPDSGRATVQTFNDSVGPYVGLRIEADGSVITVPITAGPHAGKTMEQVLGE